MEHEENLDGLDISLDGVRHNTTQNGIEVKFDAVPNFEDTSWLKRKGFRWSGRQKLWYVKYSEALFNEVKAKFDVALTDEQKKEAQAKAEQARANEAADKQNRIKNGFESWKQANSEVWLYGHQPFRIFHDERPNFVTVRGIRYHLENDKKDGWHYQYLPNGRKRPDKYGQATIHAKMQDEIIANGGYISFENYFSNPNQRSRISKYLLDDINRLLKHEWMQSPENTAYKVKVERQVNEANVIAKQWGEYRKRVFSEFKEKKKPLYMKDDKGMWIPVQISGSLETEISGSSRQDLINVSDHRGYIIFMSWALISNVYPENPADNPNVKSFLELYPPTEVTAKPEPVPAPPEPIQEVEAEKQPTEPDKPKYKTHNDIIAYLESEGVFIRTGTEAQVLAAIKKLDEAQLPDIYNAFNPKTKQAKLEKLVHNIYLYEYRRVKPVNTKLAKKG